MLLLHPTVRRRGPSIPVIPSRLVSIALCLVMCGCGDADDPNPTYVNLEGAPNGLPISAPPPLEPAGVGGSVLPDTPLPGPGPGNPNPEPGPGTPDPTPGTAPPGCAASAHGILWEAVDPISYHGESVELSATHVLGNGCMTGLKLTFLRGGACPLDLAFTGEGGSWTLQSASLRSDPQCGAGWGSGKVYNALMSQSWGTVTNMPGAVDAPGSTATCATLGTKLDLKGELVLSGGGTTINMAPTMLRVSGGIPSFGGGGACGQAPAACLGVECGVDPFGYDCGICGSDQACVSGHCVGNPPAGGDSGAGGPPPDNGGGGGGDGPVVTCPSGGTGTTVGSQIKDINWSGGNGQPYSLHTSCGTQKAVFMVQTAEW